MHIQRETPDTNTIRSYTDTQFTVGTADYQHSAIISRDSITSPWPIYSIDELNEVNLEPLLACSPELIIIGHQQLSRYTPMPVTQYLSKRRVGIECMSIGAASRTFNVLLSEQRNVVIGIIFGLINE